MSNNLQTYHKTLQQLCQWLPQKESPACVIWLGLFWSLQLSGAIHLPLIVRKWPLPGALPSLTELIGVAF